MKVQFRAKASEASVSETPRTPEPIESVRVDHTRNLLILSDVGAACEVEDDAPAENDGPERCRGESPSSGQAADGHRLITSSKTKPKKCWKRGIRRSQSIDKDI